MPDYPADLRAGVERMVAAGESEQNIAAAIAAYKQRQGAAAPASQDTQGSGGASMALLAARGVPAAIRTGAGFVAEHPAAVQKVISAGMSGVAGSIGAGVAGVPGAIIGASMRGLAPKQGTIRTVAGRLAGESPDVAQSAGRALGIQNYIKSTSGLKVKPTDILERPQGLPAAEAYAKSQGRGIMKILGPNGEVVVGPTAAAPVAEAAKPAASVAAKGASTLGNILPWLQAATAVTDFAQTVEPNRHDIGVMGIGRSYTPEQVQAQLAANPQAAQNQQQAEADFAAQGGHQLSWGELPGYVKNALLSRLGFR